MEARASRWMRGALCACGLLCATLSVAGLAPAQSPAPADPAHGKYLVTEAGQCGDCHGPELAGEPNLRPAPPGRPWAKMIPSLRGLTMFDTDAAAIAFLTTAKLPDGSNALPPMPHYRFNVADATAIVTYLRSLK